MDEGPAIKTKVNVNKKGAIDGRHSGVKNPGNEP